MILDKTGRAKKEIKESNNKEEDEADVRPQGEFGSPERQHESRILILGGKIKATQKKADARTDRKRHALQETKSRWEFGRGVSDVRPEALDTRRVGAMKPDRP